MIVASTFFLKAKHSKNSRTNCQLSVKWT